MDGCSLFALVACLSWSNLYIDGGVQMQDVGTFSETYRYFDSVTAVEGNITRQSFASEKHELFKDNPYGRIALGYQIEFVNLTWRLEAAHVSSLSTGKDRGVNAISISARWYPFRH